MTVSEATAAARPKLSVRAGASRKLLERKAVERTGDEQGSAEPALEESFPPATRDGVAECDQAAGEGADELAANTAEPEQPEPATASAPANPAPAAALPVPPPTARPTLPARLTAWSAEDESHLQSLLARRKAAGYQRRGRDVSGQLIRPGDIEPNPDTVVAVIVGIVAERGNITRAELLAAMAVAAFPHPRAQPADKGWCQGYVAGAIRNGFLARSADASAQAA